MRRRPVLGQHTIPPNFLACQGPTSRKPISSKPACILGNIVCPPSDLLTMARRHLGHQCDYYLQKEAPAHPRQQYTYQSDTPSRTDPLPKLLSGTHGYSDIVLKNRSFLRRRRCIKQSA